MTPKGVTSRNHGWVLQIVEVTCTLAQSSHRPHRALGCLPALPCESDSRAIISSSFLD